MTRIDLSACEKLDPDVLADARRISQKMSERVSPPGAFKNLIPDLLEQRRLEYGIPDGAFWGSAVYDRVLVYQIDRTVGETFENTIIHRADISKAREREECPVGIIVGAGLNALDSLRSHGIDLGHKVVFVHLAPFRFQCDTVDGKPEYILLLRSGDIIMSADLKDSVLGGAAHIRSFARPNGKDATGYSLPPSTFHYLDRGDGTLNVPVPGEIFEE